MHISYVYFVTCRRQFKVIYKPRGQITTHMYMYCTTNQHVNSSSKETSLWPNVQRTVWFIVFLYNKHQTPSYEGTISSNSLGQACINQRQVWLASAPDNRQTKCPGSNPSAPSNPHTHQASAVQIRPHWPLGQRADRFIKVPCRVALTEISNHGQHDINGCAAATWTCYGFLLLPYKHWHRRWKPLPLTKMTHILGAYIIVLLDQWQRGLGIRDFMLADIWCS